MQRPAFSSQSSVLGLSTLNSQPSTGPRWSRAFSLIEVVISVGIFAGAIVIILALLGPLNRSIGEVADNGRAARLADAINVELLRLRDKQLVPKLDNLANLTNATAGLILYASADGSRVVADADAGDDPINPAAGTPPGIVASDRYYLVTVRTQPSPLNYTPGTSAFLAVTATITWPYQTPGGPGPAASADASTRAQAQTLLFNYALPP